LADAVQDPRGLLEINSKGAFDEVGAELEFVQDKCYNSSARGDQGLISRRPPCQAKLVWAIREKYKTIVYLREGSSTYLKWRPSSFPQYGPLMLFSRGKPTASAPWSPTPAFIIGGRSVCPSSDCGIRWDDPDLAVSWPVSSPLLSEKDSKLQLLKEIDLKSCV
jgi:dTDP-4-dehydrorhamnose 3,5-epimerase